MIQNWSIRSRATHCALSERAFEEGEVFHTAIYFDPETSGYLRRDVAIDVWPQEISERKPIAYWRTTYTPNVVEVKPEVTSKESAMALLQRFIEEDDPMTENARYILALMLERKRILSPTATKEVDGNKMLFYENKKTGEVFIVRDPELRLSELAAVQDEVAMLLGFGGPAAEAAKIAGMKFTPDGKLVKADEPAPEVTAPAPAAEAPETATAEAEAPAETASVEPASEAEDDAAVAEDEAAAAEEASTEAAEDVPDVEAGAEAPVSEAEADFEFEAESEESESEPPAPESDLPEPESEPASHPPAA